MTDILVRDVPEPVLLALKERAARQRRSLQHEVLTILEAAAREPSAASPVEVAARIRERLAHGGRRFGDSVIQVREDRQR
jgi:plasmid stability protein